MTVCAATANIAGELRLPEEVGTQTKLMLCGRLFAFLLCLLAAGFAFAGEAASASMQGDQTCMQQDANAGGGDGMAANTCVVYCAAGVCVVSAVPAPQLTARAVRPFTHETALVPDCWAAPETAPP